VSAHSARAPLPLLLPLPWETLVAARSASSSIPLSSAPAVDVPLPTAESPKTKKSKYLLLPAFIASNMVLQRAPARAVLWGWATPGAQVTYTPYSKHPKS
jgi:hypothetical protein